jgi:OFA family oxalate/formate antiporter-like MFS transporter
MVGGYGGGQAIFGPLAQESLIPAVGWRTTFQILSVVFLIMTMVGAVLIKNPPAGYRPAGWTPKPVPAGARTDFTTGEMLATPTFYLLWIAYAFGTTAGQMTISQLVPFARAAGLGATIAAYSLIVTSASNAGGRILSGLLSDKIGRIPTLRLMVLLSAIAMPALFLWRAEVLPFFVLIGLVYWCYGTQLSVFASTAGDFFGTKNLGLNYGVLFTAWGFAGILGPSIAGNIYTRFGDYRYAFFSAAAFALVALVALLFAKPPQHQKA